MLEITGNQYCASLLMPTRKFYIMKGSAAGSNYYYMFNKV